MAASHRELKLVRWWAASVVYRGQFHPLGVAQDLAVEGPFVFQEKTNPPLAVDADAVLRLAVTLQCL